MAGTSKTGARVIVGLDFGTTYSGFAYAHVREPDKVYTFYEWPFQAKCGGMPYCKTITGSYYSAAGSEVFKREGRGQRNLTVELKSWGWEARKNFTEDLQELQACKKQIEHTSKSARKLPSLGSYLTRFKLHLANKDFGPGHAPDLPGGLAASQVVSDFLRGIGSFILEHLRGKYGKHFSKEDIQWCVTVPSIWDDKAKQQMKVCMTLAGLVDSGAEGQGSPFPLMIALEPEAAAVYCYQISDNLRMASAGDKFLVADVGGGTTDIVVQEKVNITGTLQVREVSRSSGGLCGGTHTDMNFIAWLRQTIGCLEEFLVENPGTMHTLLRWWESTKCGFDGSDSADLQLSSKLACAWKAFDRKTGRQATRSTYDEVELSCADLAQCFDPVVDQILDLISDQILECGKIKAMMVVGGFSASPYLMKRIRGRFAGRVEEIISPPNPGSAVCQGAVMLAFKKDTIRSRVARKTYGIESRLPFKDDDILAYRVVDSQGVVRCMYTFSIFVRKGVKTNLDQCVTRRFVPSEPRQRSIRFQLYSSTEKDPRYTTTDDCKEEGSITIDISDSVELDFKREFEVSMYFGRSMIEIKAVGVNFGDHKVHAMLPVNYVADWA